MSHHIVFVTGTDTGVGKTVASAWLAKESRDAGITTGYCKPIQTGVETGEPGDAEYVAQETGLPVFELLRLKDPLAPAVAAQREGTRIDLSDLVVQIRSLAESFEMLIVEGAGGLLVPIHGAATMADLAVLLEAPLVVVARPGLGTLNHILLTQEAAERRALRIDRLVLCDWPLHPGLAERTNLELLNRLFSSVLLIPHTDGLRVDMG
ncbi:MAG: dethiobiotin synthase [Actinomycetota bacterium]